LEEINLTYNIFAEFKAKQEVIKKEVLDKLLVSLKTATPVDTGKARDAWQIVEGKIVNNTDYIADLNEGSSTQAPTNFIEQTVLMQRGVKPNGNVVTRLGD
jgi:hypothetical protein